MNDKKEEYLQKVLECQNAHEAYFNCGSHTDRQRYRSECLLLGELARYALNKPKNVDKPNFEDLNIVDILGHLVEEIHELTYEFKQENFDYERILSECADCAGMLSGLIAWIISNKDKK